MKLHLNVAETIVFLRGNPQMVESVKEQLLSAG